MLQIIISTLPILFIIITLHTVIYCHYLMFMCCYENENEQQNGISHFLEHMAFKGTQRRTYLDIAKQIEEIGGYMNAFTSKEKTVYYVKVLKEHLELGIDLLSDILQNSTFPEEEIEKERLDADPAAATCMNHLEK